MHACHTFFSLKNLEDSHQCNAGSVDIGLYFSFLTLTIANKTYIHANLNYIECFLYEMHVKGFEYSLFNLSFKTLGELKKSKDL